MTRSSLMRASDALATQTATYAIPLLILVTTGSTALTGVALLLEWLPRLVAFTLGGPLVDRFRADRVFRTAALARTLLCAAAAAALALPPAADTAATVVVMTVGAAGGLLSQASFLAVETLGAHASRRAGADAHRVQSVQIGSDQTDRSRHRHRNPPAAAPDPRPRRSDPVPLPRPVRHRAAPGPAQPPHRTELGGAAGDHLRAGRSRGRSASSRLRRQPRALDRARHA